jgi:hypothetical protein
MDPPTRDRLGFGAAHPTASGSRSTAAWRWRGLDPPAATSPTLSGPQAGARGFVNLSCLGLLSDRILGRHAQGPPRAAARRFSRDASPAQALSGIGVPDR